MAKCAWCDKSLPGDAVPACGSCLLRPSPQSVEESQPAEGKDSSNTDLSYLDDSNKKSAEQPKKKSRWEVQSDLASMVNKRPTPLQERVMKRLKIKSNYLRDRTFMYEDLLLRFDDSGVADFPADELPTIRKLMRVRPGRFWFLEDTEEVDVETQLEKARNALVELQNEEAFKEEKTVSEEEPVEDSRSGLRILRQDSNSSSELSQAKVEEDDSEKEMPAVTKAAPKKKRPRSKKKSTKK